MSFLNPEPEVHCYDCPNSKNGKCAEYSELNPGWVRMSLGNYDRGHCHWGYESIHKVGNNVEAS